MKLRLLNAVDRLDWHIARLALPYQSEAGTLVVVFCHSLFESDAEIASGLMNPLEGMTVRRAKETIEQLQSAGYTFVAPAAIPSLSPHGQYAIFTTDDGYYNNIRLLEIAKEFQAPAVCFTCTYHVIEGRGFWWDVLWRQRIRRGTAVDPIRAETDWLSTLSHGPRETYLVDNFGADSLDPVSDLDRPFRPAELQAFAASPLMSVGAHTRHHENLCSVSAAAAEKEIAANLDELERIAGYRPEIFSYPHGAWNPTVAKIVSRAGLRYAFTTSHCRNGLPASGPHSTLGRFSVTEAEPVSMQCSRVRSKLRLRQATSSLNAYLRNFETWRDWHQAGGRRSPYSATGTPN